MFGGRDGQQGSGGGVATTDSAAGTSIARSTIVGDSAGADESLADPLGQGGDSISRSVASTSRIPSLPKTPARPVTDVRGTVGSGGNNLIGDATGGGGFESARAPTGGTVNVIDPMLGALADNGGSTQPMLYSPAAPPSTPPTRPEPRPSTSAGHRSSAPRTAISPEAANPTSAPSNSPSPPTSSIPSPTRTTASALARARRFARPSPPPTAGAASHEFAVAGTIFPTSDLPEITRDDLVVDGTTAPGYIDGGLPVVGIDGTNAGNTNGLRLFSANGASLVAIGVGNYGLNGIFVIGSE